MFLPEEKVDRRFCTVFKMRVEFFEFAAGPCRVGPTAQRILVQIHLKAERIQPRENLSVLKQKIIVY